MPIRIILFYFSKIYFLWHSTTEKTEEMTRQKVETGKIFQLLNGRLFPDLAGRARSVGSNELRQKIGIPDKDD